MPAPPAIGRLNKLFLNKILIHAAGHGWFVDLEHVGRRTGTVHHTPLLAFRDGDRVAIALTYGPTVQWLKNLRSAGGGRMLLKKSLLVLGAPVGLSTAEGLSVMPPLVRTALQGPLKVTDFVALPILDEHPRVRG